MLKRINLYLFRSSDEIGFDNYLILILSFLIVVLGFLSTITNIALNLSLEIIASTAIPAILFLPLYFYSRITGHFIVSKYILTISAIVLLNIQWFINYGSNGPVIFLFVVLETFILTFFQNRTKFIFTIFLFVNLTLLFFVEYNYPYLFDKYPSDLARLIDLYIGVNIYLFISIFFVNIAMKFYIDEQKKAKLSDKLKSAFLANMSHEIRTPMNGILGFAELLKNPNLSGTEQQEYLRIIEKSGMRMLNIINDIIDISKIESGLMQLDIKEINFNEQLEYICTFFKPEVEIKGITFLYNKTLPSKIAILKTDGEKLFAILTNLVKNAIKYSNNGTIEIGYLKKDAKIEFYVKDTGIGIPKNRQAAIFERFIQADITDKMAHQGAGLGLSITKAYVEMLDGKIWVESEENKGSTFYFTLPYTTDLKEKVMNKKNDFIEETASPHAKYKILIVEDEIYSQVLLSKYLNDISKEISIAKDGFEAIEICRKHPDIDLILMDILMPNMNGYEATKEIRKFNSDVIIIAQTAYGLSGDRQKSIEAGCNDYIAKPINHVELLSLIHTCFN